MHQDCYTGVPKTQVALLYHTWSEAKGNEWHHPLATVPAKVDLLGSSLEAIVDKDFVARK